MADSSLQAIETKIRRLTRSPSDAQLSTNDIKEYVNTFVLYDFPEHLRDFALRTTFTFYANAFQDVYPTDKSMSPDDPLYDFQNRYITVHPPVYIAGYNSFYTQSREQFFGIYPLTNSILTIGASGDGLTTKFSGVINNNTGPNFVNPTLSNQTSVLLKNNVLFSSVNLYNQGISLIDVPVLDSITLQPTSYGNLYVPGTEPSTPPTAVAPYTPTVGGTPNADNYINYLTGEFTATFPSAPGVGQAINSQTIPQVVSLPQALLYYDDAFTLRPVPDQPYRVDFEVYIRPTELLESNSEPKLSQWWQYIAYGAAKKVFEDRGDLESVQLIMPEFKKQESLVLRRTIVQYTNERTATIYTEQLGQIGFNQWGAYGGPF